MQRSPGCVQRAALDPAGAGRWVVGAVGSLQHWPGASAPPRKGHECQLANSQFIQLFCIKMSFLALKMLLRASTTSLGKPKLSKTPWEGDGRSLPIFPADPPHPVLPVQSPHTLCTWGSLLKGPAAVRQCSALLCPGTTGTGFAPGTMLSPCTAAAADAERALGLCQSQGLLTLSSPSLPGSLSSAVCRGCCGFSTGDRAG